MEMKNEKKLSSDLFSRQAPACCQWRKRFSFNVDISDIAKERLDCVRDAVFIEPSHATRHCIRDLLQRYSYHSRKYAFSD